MEVGMLKMAMVVGLVVLTALPAFAVQRTVLLEDFLNAG
jgi:hypothetical protein